MSEFNYKQWLVENKVGPYSKDLKESGTGDAPFNFNKAAIESASGDKISHTEEDDYGRPIYWSTKNPNVTYYISDDDQIIKYDGETGERYPIGDLKNYDEPDFDIEPDTDADYEEPVDRNIQSDYNDGEFWEGKEEVKEWIGMDPEDSHAMHLINKLRDLKGDNKINDANFKKAENYINKNAYDLYYDFSDPERALKHVLKAIKSGVSYGKDYSVGDVASEVQKLADQLVADGKYKPEQAKRVVAYAAKHQDDLFNRLDAPMQWFNASAQATQQGKGTKTNELYHPDDPAGWDSAAARGEDDDYEEEEGEQLTADDVKDILSSELTPEEMKESRIRDTTYGYVEFRYGYWEGLIPQNVTNVLEAHFDVKENNVDSDEGRLYYLELRPKQNKGIGSEQHQMGEYYDKNALQNQAHDLDSDRGWSFSADWDDSNFESDQKEYLKKLAWVLKQKGASNQEIKKVFKDSYLLGKDRIRKSYYDIYQDVKNWSKRKPN
jgi:hypothetical protein